MIRARVIINADDLALTDMVTEATLETATRGVLSSTTAMVCVPGAEDRLRRVADTLAGRIGCHLQLTGGRPCLDPSEIPSLVGPDGRFPDHRNGLGACDPDEVAREWEAQIARLRGWGIEPTHLDSHHHVHCRRELIPAFAEVASRHGLPGRACGTGEARRLRELGVKTPSDLLMLSGVRPLTSALVMGRLRLALRMAGPGSVVELGCHPGYPQDAALAAISGYVDARVEETQLLCSAELRDALNAEGIKIVGFADLGT